VQIDVSSAEAISNHGEHRMMEKGPSKAEAIPQSCKTGKTHKREINMAHSVDCSVVISHQVSPAAQMPCPAVHGWDKTFTPWQNHT
jgi:hypothetical protein